MTTAPSSDPQGKVQKPGVAASQDDLPVTAADLDEKVHEFWAKNRQQVIYGCAAVLLVIVAKEGWQHFAAVRERNLQTEFATVSTSPAKLAVFADAHSSHPLGGVAYLTLADQKFEAGEFKPAAAFYQKARGILTSPALIGRARVGGAVSNLNAGDRAAGESALKAIATDAAQLKATRSEASYHLASLAAEAGQADDVRRLVEEIGKIDPASMWSQRATLLLVNLPAAAKKADAAATPAISFKPGGK